MWNRQTGIICFTACRTMESSHAVFLICLNSYIVLQERRVLMTVLKDRCKVGYCIIILALLASGCASIQKRSSAPEIPIFRYEQFVHNEGFRGKFAFESHDIISLTKDRKKTDATFKFTGAILGRLTGEQKSVQIIRLDKDLIWQINVNKKRYLEYPIKKAAIHAGVVLDDPAGETEYIEDCCKVRTAIKRTGVKKVINSYDAEEVILTMSSSCQDEVGQQPNTVTFALDVWLAPKVPMQDLESFDRSYAAKVGMDVQMFQAMGEQFMKMYPSIKDLALMLRDVKGHPILSTLTVEDSNYLKKQQEENMREQHQKGETKTGGSPTEIVTGFFSKKVSEQEEKKQQEEELKWGNVIWRMTWESRNFQNMQIPADEFDLPEGFKKVEQKENLEGDQGKTITETRPVHFVKTACLSSLTKSQLGIAVYPGAMRAHAGPYNESDRNTQWYFKNKSDYRVQYSTQDSIEKVTAFYKKAFKSRCTVSTQQEGGKSYKEAVCSKVTGPGLIQTFKMSEKPLELRANEGSMPTMPESPPHNLFGFELSVGKLK